MKKLDTPDDALAVSAKQRRETHTDHPLRHFDQTCLACQHEAVMEWIECQEFYELMEAYRHAPQGRALEPYRAVKSFIANEVLDDRDEQRSALSQSRRTMPEIETLLKGVRRGIASHGTYSEDAINAFQALESEIDVLIACASSSKAPCGHDERYCYTEDGGKNIVCLLCERERTRSSTQRIVHPLEDAVYKTAKLYGDRQQHCDHPLSYQQQIENDAILLAWAVLSGWTPDEAVASAIRPMMPTQGEILLACGELKASELRAVKAALQWFITTRCAR